jgi:hypothetical protein
MTEQLSDWIQDELKALQFVEWDRFVTGEWSEGVDYVTVYGWIDRDDAYKDFVVVTFWDDRGRWFTTSSDEYTVEIHQSLFDESPDKHNDCQRIEHATDIGNVVEL